MTLLPSLTGKELVAKLKKAGFEVIRVKGSHHFLRHADGRSTVVPASDKALTDILSLVRFATGQVDLLEPYAARVEQRFNLWIGCQIKAGRNFNEEQMNWLKAIKDPPMSRSHPPT